MGRPEMCPLHWDLLPAEMRFIFHPRCVRLAPSRLRPGWVSCGRYLCCYTRAGIPSARLCTMADVSSRSECAAATCWQQEPEIHLINERCCCFPLSGRTWQPPNGLEEHQIPQGRETEFPALPHDFRALRGEDSERFISQTPADTLRRVHIGAALAAEFLMAEGLRIPPFCLCGSGD